MAAIPPIDYAAGQDKFQQLYDSHNAIIAALNAITAQNELQTTIVNIGDWNMDTSVTVSVAHGLADFTKVRSVLVMVRNDTNDTYYPLDSGVAGGGGGAANGFVQSIDTTNIVLGRNTSGLFDDAAFNATSYNRGYILIQSIK